MSQFEILPVEATTGAICSSSAEALTYSEESQRLDILSRLQARGEAIVAAASLNLAVLYIGAKYMGGAIGPGRWEDTSDPDWRDRAACKDVDPDLFFPTSNTGPALDQIEAAKAVCRACPVQRICLEFAMMTNQQHGIWGGTTDEQRRKMRRNWLASRRRNGN